MTLSRKVRTFGVGLKSYLSSGMTSTIPMTRLRVLSHVALAGVRKLAAGKPGWAAAAPTVPSIRSAAITTLRVNELLVIVPPLATISRYAPAQRTKHGFRLTPTLRGRERAARVPGALKRKFDARYDAAPW